MSLLITFLDTVEALAGVGAVAIALLIGLQANKTAQLVKDYETSPLLVPQSEGNLQKNKSTQMPLTLLNIGKGAAKGIDIYINGKLMEGNLPFIAAGDKSVISHVPADDKVEAIRQILERDPKELTLSVRYKDIFDNTYETRMIMQDQQGPFVVNRGTWKVVKL